MFRFDLTTILLLSGLVYITLAAIVLLLAVSMARAGKLEDERMGETHIRPPDSLR